MASKGASALTDAELLAILIGSGNSDDSAVALMQKVLASCSGSLATLSRRSVQELCAFKGIGPAKAITIQAACELGRRRAHESKPHTIITNSRQVFEYFRPTCCDLPTEEGHVLLLNNAAKIISSIRVSSGGQCATVIDIREVLREALLHRATAIVLVHNHPSGSVRPSTQDDELTRQLATAARTMNINMMDHVIIGDNDYYSYADEGRL